MNAKTTVALLTAAFSLASAGQSFTGTSHERDSYAMFSATGLTELIMISYTPKCKKAMLLFGEDGIRDGISSSGRLVIGNFESRPMPVKSDNSISFVMLDLVPLILLEDSGGTLGKEASFVTDKGVAKFSLDGMGKALNLAKENCRKAESEE